MSDSTKSQLEGIISSAQTAMELVAEAQFLHGRPLLDLRDHAVRYFDAAFDIASGFISDYPPSLRDSWSTGADDEAFTEGTSTPQPAN